MPPQITPVDHLLAHIRSFCKANSIRPAIYIPAGEELVFRIGGKIVKFTLTEITNNTALPALVAARIKAVMP